MSDPDAPPFPMSEHGMMMTLPPGALLPDGALRSPETSLPIGTRLGEFEITGLIGEGGFGIVYMATDHLLGRQVALKEYMPSALAARGTRAQVGVKSERHAETFEAGRRSFINEARLLAQFDHPALVKVFRFWEANGTAYMVMPYYRGRTLRQALTDMGAPPSQAWLERLLVPLVEALETLHAAHCYHRDIAPDNILLLDSGRPVLLDFGAARRVIGDITQALTVILKPGFAPVEQYANGPEMKQGPWTDVYALAAVVYYCATLKTPVPSVSRMMKDTLQPLSQLAGDRYDAGFCAAVDRGLAVTVEARIQDMAEFRAALGLDGGGGAQGAQLPGTTQLAGGRGSEMDATVIDPSALAWARGTGPAGGAPFGSAAPDRLPSRLNEDTVMSALPPEQDRNETPWRPNADVQMERAAAQAESAPRRRGIPWLPVAAVMLLAGAGVGGYWYWSQSAGDPSTPGSQDMAPPNAGLPAQLPPASPSPAQSRAQSADQSPGQSRAQSPIPSPTAPPAVTSPAGPPLALSPSPAPPGLAPAPAPPRVPSLVPETVPPPADAPVSGLGRATDGSGGLPAVGTIIDALHRERDIGWQVSVQVTADRVRIGKDRLRFRLRSERDGYVYLLMQGTDRSHFYQLFPNGLDQSNRLRGKVEMALPRPNWEMVAGGPPGLNRFIALVTPTPRNFGSAGLNSSQPFSEFDVEAAARIFSERGAAPFAGAPVGCKGDERSCTAYGSVVFEIEEY